MVNPSARITNPNMVQVPVLETPFGSLTPEKIFPVRPLIAGKMNPKTRKWRNLLNRGFIQILARTTFNKHLFVRRREKQFSILSGNPRMHAIQQGNDECNRQ